MYRTKSSLSPCVSTGPEIWRQTEGKVDGFICAVGTGGTLAGTSTYLKEQNSNIQIGCADPLGKSLFRCQLCLLP